ncbi:MAG TPA: nitroreductase family protein [Acetobacteraceae bacterium]|jgi:nitroreductase|nr:nitroreductase family protein [Acetobacteraceae bacterium]
MTQVGNRTSDHEIDPIFLERWSPRAFTGEPIPVEDLMRIFEAARWAPSSYNSQPWRFVYARRDTPHWEPMLGLLNEFNRSWAKNAAAVVITASNSVMLPPGAEKPVPSWSHSFDAGAAWGNLALQATRLGWDAHAMVGFDRERAFAELNFPEGYRVEAAIALGRRGDPSILPESLRARERPSDRNPLSATVFEGTFKA